MLTGHTSDSSPCNAISFPCLRHGVLPEGWQCWQCPLWKQEAARIHVTGRAFQGELKMRHMQEKKKKKREVGGCKKQKRLMSFKGKCCPTEMWISWPEPEVLCPLTPLQVPNYVVHQLAAPHHRRNSLLSCRKARGGRKMGKKKCQSLIIQSSS